MRLTLADAPQFQVTPLPRKAKNRGLIPNGNSNRHPLNKLTGNLTGFRRSYYQLTRPGKSLSVH